MFVAPPCVISLIAIRIRVLIRIQGHFWAQNRACEAMSICVFVLEVMFCGLNKNARKTNHSSSRYDSKEIFIVCIYNSLTNNCELDALNEYSILDTRFTDHQITLINSCVAESDVLQEERAVSPQEHRLRDIGTLPISISLKKLLSHPLKHWVLDGLPLDVGCFSSLQLWCHCAWQYGRETHFRWCVDNQWEGRGACETGKLDKIQIQLYERKLRNQLIISFCMLTDTNHKPLQKIDWEPEKRC